MDDPAERGRLLQRLLESSSWERAAALARKSLAEEPDNAEWHRTAGQCALHMNRPGEAEKHLADALRLAPEDDLALYFLAHAMRLGKKPAEAERAVKRAIEIDPSDADYWTELGWLSFESEDYPAALRCARRACDTDGANTRAATLLAAAESQLPASAGGNQGDPEAQIRSLQKTLELDPENDAALHNIGVVYFNELADYRSAERYFRNALALEPGEPLYQRNLTRSLRRQDPVLRALYAPWRVVVAVFECITWAWERRWPLLVGLPLAPFLVGGAMLVALFWAIFLWPPAAFYEYLTRPELVSATGRLSVPKAASRLGWLHARSPQRWSKTARLTLFLATFTAFWLALITAFRALAFRAVITNTLIALLGAWVAITIYACAREVGAARERRRRRRSIDLLEG